MRSSPHPGRIIRQDCIEPLGLSISGAAEARRHMADPLANIRRVDRATEPA